MCLSGETSRQPLLSEVSVIQRTTEQSTEPHQQEISSEQQGRWY